MGWFFIAFCFTPLLARCSHGECAVRDVNHREGDAVGVECAVGAGGLVIGHVVVRDVIIIVSRSVDGGYEGVVGGVV